MSLRYVSGIGSLLIAPYRYGNGASDLVFPEIESIGMQQICSN